ncbi:glutamine--fructose-6-phosphate transaminase (isomerizing) [Candidatus Falkowbacteria bacterium]|nr:glutamine--fructose-6-phosphate transaminase (isomerizing) [Candidatus Falkowbacteria bacterium]
MCGIVGYIGKNNALPVLIDGLKRLEYRGYDSAGVALVIFPAGKSRAIPQYCGTAHVNLMDGVSVFSVKAVGRISELEKKLKSPPAPPAGGIKGGNIGIAHTRWATHGAPTEANAHPHTDCFGKIWLVHNGIVENYQQLKNHLEEKGHKFISETDTEVVAHLVEDFYNGNLTEALQRALKMIKGTYGLAVIHTDEPNKILVAKHGSPLVIGLGDGETIIASDVSAILRYTKQVIYLDDGEIAEVHPAPFARSAFSAESTKDERCGVNGDGLKIFNALDVEINKASEKVEWNLGQAEKGEFPHFMLKEIFEQPKTILDSMRGRIITEEGKVKLGGLEAVADKTREIERIIISACGTARHAGLIGEYMIEEYAGIPVEVDYSSEFRYRQPVINEKTAVLAISQSGETADTLAAIKETKEKGALALGIVNVVGSSIARLTDAGVYNHIGPEIAVASSKAFTSQLAILTLLTIFLGRQRNMSLMIGKRIISELEMLPEKMKSVLKQNERIKKIAQKYSKAKDFAFLGRKYNSALAMEGALKLKELSYVHAEGFAAGEMKHGPIAMIDENFPSLFIAPQDSVYEKNLSNMAEIKARKGPIIAIATEGDEKIKDLADDVIYIPKTLEMLTPILAAVPLQLFAYHTAVIKGLDVDKPRNLAKSVTVE